MPEVSSNIEQTLAMIRAGRSSRVNRKRGSRFNPRPLEDKGLAINPDLVKDLYKEFHVDISPEEATKIAASSRNEHRIFSNPGTLTDLENWSLETCVGIAKIETGPMKGYVLVGNPNKGPAGIGSFGFPGGRVHPGETRAASLKREIFEETGLECEIVGADPIAEMTVGEEEHKFSAFQVRITGGKIQVPQDHKGKPLNPEEPIDSVIIVSEEVLERACRQGGCIQVKGLPPRVVLFSHRKSFLTFQNRKAESNNGGGSNV